MPFSYRIRCAIVALGLLGAGLLFAEPPKVDSTQVLDHYLSAWRAQQSRQNGLVADVSIDAEVPRLHKHGRLAGLRRISRLGRLTYDVLRFEGDNSVKTNVIARYLAAEVQVRDSGESLSVTPENYKFSYKGLRRTGDRDAHVFDVKPRASRAGLFKGEIWIDAQTYLTVRESGRFVKNPSIFIKKVEFTRDYRQEAGVAVVAQLDTTVETRVVGPAHMTVHFEDYRFEAPPVDVGQSAAGNE